MVPLVAKCANESEEEGESRQNGAKRAYGPHIQLFQGLQILDARIFEGKTDSARILSQGDAGFGRNPHQKRFNDWQIPVEARGRRRAVC